MDSMLLWILICAGAIVALLGVFLAFSEKELRKKNRELAALSARLNHDVSSSLLGQAVDKDQMVKLERKNKELLEQVSTLANKLEASERELAEWEGERWRLKKADAERRQLETAARKLGDEVKELRERIHTSATLESRFQFQKEALEDQVATLSSELEAATAELEQSRARIRELETSSDAMSRDNTERSREPRGTERAVQISALREELSQARKKLQSFDAVNHQLLDLQQAHEKLHLEHQRLKQDRADRQQPLEDAINAQHPHNLVELEPEEMRQLATGGNQDEAKMFEGHDVVPVLRPRLLPTPSTDGTRASSQPSPPIPLAPADHARLCEPILLPALTQLPENDKLLRETTPAEATCVRPCEDTQLAELLNTPDLNAYERRLVRETFLAMAEAAHSRGRNDETLRYRRLADRIVASPLSMTETELDSPTRTELGEPLGQKREMEADTRAGTDLNSKLEDNSRLAKARSQDTGRVIRKLLPGGGVAVAVLLLLKILTSGTGEDPAAPPTSSAPDTTAGVVNQQHDAFAAAAASATAAAKVRTASIPSERPEKLAQVKTSSSERLETNAATRITTVWGAYSIIREATVYSEPSENSVYVSTLSVGSQVNVVADRGGWYEIRSKDGRPSGFIRSSTASRLR